MTPIADIDRIARCIGNRTQYPWRFSKLFVPQLRASRRSKRKRGRDNCRLLTPSLPLSRSPDLPVCLARFPAARLWLKDESLKDSANLPDPDIIAAEIVEDLQAALAQFGEIAADLKR